MTSYLQRLAQRAAGITPAERLQPAIQPGPLPQLRIPSSRVKTLDSILVLLANQRQPPNHQFSCQPPRPNRLWYPQR